jgi:hypothetical protein
VKHGVRPPSRATVYNSLATIEGHTYRVAALPPEARRAVYNLSADASVPGHCFNHGSLAAACFAAGLPWLDLYQASRLPGWRPRSRGLLLAAMRARGLQ